MPLLSGFGACACAASAVLIATAVCQRAWSSVLMLILRFGGGAGALLWMAAAVDAGEDGLTAIRLRKRVRVAWRDTVAAGGDADTLSLRTRDRRERLLSPSCWHGPDKHRLSPLLREQLLAHGADVAPRLRRFLRMDDALPGVYLREAGA